MDDQCCKNPKWLMGILLAFVIAVGSYSYFKGNILKISKGLDSDLRVCGVDKGVEDYPFTYFPNPNKNYLYQAVCVMECPQLINDIIELKCATNQIVESCEVKHSILQSKDNRLIYDTFAFKNNVCVPKNVDYFNQISESYTPLQFYKFFVVDLQQYNVYSRNTKWSTVLGTTFLTTLICFFVWVFLQQTEKNPHLFWIYQQIILFLFFLLASFFALKTYKDFYIDDQSTQTPVEISESYLSKKQNLFSFLLHLFFTLFYTICFIFGEYMFFTYQNEFQAASFIFSITHQEEEKLQINGFIFFNIIYQSIGYIALLLIFEYVTLHTLACHNTQKNIDVGPFQQFYPNIIAYFAIVCVLLAFLTLVLYVRYIYHSTFQIFIQYYQNKLQIQQDGKQKEDKSQLWLTLSQLWSDFNKDIFEIVSQGSNFTSLLCIPYSLIKKLYVLKNSENFKSIDKVQQSQVSQQFEEINQISNTYFFIIIFVITIVVSSIMFYILSFNYFLSEVYSLAPATILSQIISYNIAQIFFMQYESTLQSFLCVRELDKKKTINRDSQIIKIDQRIDSQIIKIDERIAQTLTQQRF